MNLDAGKLRSLPAVDHADVYKADTLAAHITRLADGSTQFTYLDNYAGPDIGFSLPKREAPVVTPGGGVPPFFTGLLPEGARLTLLQRSIKTSLDDELSLLLAVGNDTPGDVRVVPHGQKPHDVTPAFHLGDDNLNFAAITHTLDPTGIPGVQDKISASMINMPILSNEVPAILKIDPAEHPHLVHNEFLHLSHAPKLKIPVAQAHLVNDSFGRNGLLVTRFDRMVLESGVTRLPMEDAGQVLGITPSRKYAVDTATLITALASRCAMPAVATRTLFLHFAFAWLTGNGDLHAKNVSILRSSQGWWEVAPMYDLPSTVLYRDMEMALPLSGRKENLRLRHWDQLADDIGLPRTAAHSALRLARNVAAGINLEELPFQGSPLHSAERELRLRRGELTDLEKD